MASMYPYPYWWGTATTVTIAPVSGTPATFAVGDVEFLPTGVAYPDNEIADWSTGFLPWDKVAVVYKSS